MRYLLDELMSYEEGFGDMLMPDRLSDRHETFMGEAPPGSTITRTDLAVFQHTFLTQVSELLATVSPSKAGSSLMIGMYNSTSPLCTLLNTTKIQPCSDHPRTPCSP